MNAVELLKEQHRHVDELLVRLKRSTKPDDKHELFLDIAARLVGHDAIEREIFYPACERVLGKSNRLMEGIAEHGLMEFSIFQAYKARGKESFDSLVSVLAEMVKHHVEEEETSILPEATKKMGEDMLDELGDAMQERFEASMKRDFRATLRRHLQEVLTGRATAATARKRTARASVRKRAAPARGRGKKAGVSRTKRAARG